MVPVDAVVKKNPTGQTTATIGVPFTYTITAPLLGQLDSTGTFQYLKNADDYDIHNVVITDDLTKTGAALSYVSNTAWLVDPSGGRTSLGPLTLGANNTWLANHPGVLSDSTHLVFSYEKNPALKTIQAGYHIEIDLTVVLDNNTSTNKPGTPFTNMVDLWFNKTINSTDMVDLHAWPGKTLPMTIAEPNLVVDKRSTLTTMNKTTVAPFTIDVHNAGGSDAWNVTVVDRLPYVTTGTTIGGMCDTAPTGVTAKIYAADGATLVSNLVKDTDFSLTWNGAPTCEMTLTLLNTSIAKIGPSQHLIITYQAQLDTNTDDGATLTNVAGAKQWFNAPSSSVRLEYDRPLTDGTPGVLDSQDAYTIMATLAGYFFQKTVEDLSTGVSPATTAFPGDKLRYTLQLQNFNVPPLNNITITDDLGALNVGSGAFISGISVVSNTFPASTNVTTCNSCGTNGAPKITISNFSLDSNKQYQIQFDVTLASNLPDSTTVLNQANITGNNGSPVSGVSDDPYINGAAPLLGPTPNPDATSVVIQMPGALSKANPQNKTTATIGEEFTYTITVPATPINAPLYDVRILDNLSTSGADLRFVSARVVSGGTWSLTNTGTATNLTLEDLATGIDIPANGQVVIGVTVALQNTTTNHSGVTFKNTASYTYNRTNGDKSTQVTGGAGVTSNMDVVEPALTATKTVSYASPAGKAITDPAAAGDVLRYVVTIPNNGTSTAFDTSVVDTLPPNVSLVAGSATATIGGNPVTNFVKTPTTLPSGALAWGNQNGDETLDIPAGQQLVLTYNVTVLSANGASINNSVYVDWTSLDTGNAGERTGAGCPITTAPNTYCHGPASANPVPTFDPTTIVKSVVSDSYAETPPSTTNPIVRVGDTVVYSLALTLREGVTQNVVVTDALPTGLAFDSVVSITPASGSSNFTYNVASQPTAGATGTLTWNLGNITNAVDNDPANNTLVIQYLARVVKDTLAQTPTTQTLTNNATLNYAIDGVAATPKTGSSSIDVHQPILNVSKSAAPAGGDTVIVASEVITYTVDITNSGTAPAYNTVLTDTLPIGLRQAGVTTTSITLVNAGTVLPLLSPPYFSYNSTTGVATWNFDTGVANAYAIPPGETLRVVYKVTADGSLGAGMTLINKAQVQHYYSLDKQDPNVSYRQDYGATSAANVQLTTATATSLSKQALVSTAAIGQPFTYRITIPATPQPTAMYDVQVLDDISLTTTGVALSYVSASAHLASGTQSWATLTNSGTATNLILKDTTNGGLDIPANDQLVVDVVVVLNNDTVNNTVGKQFQNTANYKYNSVDNDPSTVADGAPGASGAITIVGPNLTLQKSGPSTMRVGTPETFTLTVQNTGAATAWNTVLTDILPNVTSPAPGGMCASAPTNVKATIYDSSNAVVSQLVSGTDFTVNFVGAPACTWTITMKSSTAAIAPNNHLIVTYDASLDPSTASNLSLTNVAGATQYLSADPTVPGAAGNVHTYSNTLTDGTPTVLDYQDARTLTTESPVLTFTKTVYDVTTGQSGANAKPGDTLKYTLTIQNISSLNATNFSLTDELDKLNTTAMFVPGSLTVLTIPPGATNTSSATGGTKGTGLVSISDLSIAPQGDPSGNDKLVIEFQATLVPVIANGTVVLNQAQIGSSTLPTQLSDDPALSGTSDPTRTVITSAPAFRVLKTSQDITSGTSTVNAGDTLRYTITVKNIGTENAVNVTLRDLIPANTSYVANSTKLNGVAVADPSAGVSALQNGMLVHAPAPEDVTPGAMRADATDPSTNVATITFDVIVSPNLVNGATICNQGFVNGSGVGSGAFPEQRSDNPATPTTNDSTCRVIGNVPLVNTQKTVRIAVDNNTKDLVDPGDVLEYTITLTNSAATPATGVILKDDVPADTTYVAGSVTLNGVAVPDSGGSPLVAGVAVNSPGAGSGTLAPNGTATVTFRVQVNPGVLPGTIISNQGTVTTSELPPQLTDADGDPTNGYQPTQVVVGDAQQLSITKSAVVVGGGAALPSSEVEYTIQVTNIGMVPATNVVITDDLSAISGQVSYVANSGTMNGSPNGVSYTPTVVKGDYGTLAPGSSVVLRFRVKLASTVTSGTTITNTAQVSWNSPAQTATASAPLQVGSIPGSASLNGQVWLDSNFNKVLDSTEQGLASWAVDVYRDGQLVGTVNTGADGMYHVIGITPNAGTTSRYELRFRAPGAGTNTAMLGWGDSPFTNGMQRISNIVADSNSNLQNLNLPLTPNGVVYNSITRAPAAGTTLIMVQATTKAPLPSSCFNDPVQQGQVTMANGYYKFDLNFSDPSCQPGGDYLIQVTPPAAGYQAGLSQFIPPTTSDTTAAFSVPTCPGSATDAVPSTSDYCEAVPDASVPGSNTTYYLHLTLNETQPGYTQIYNQIFNNHIPIDPVLDSAVTISKTSSLVNVTRGQLVPYTITVNNTMSVALQDLSIVDRFPAGFKYVPGSARFDDKPAEPTITGRQLNWNNLALATDTRHTIKLLLVVGAGVSEGEYVNRAQVISAITGGNVSGEASATVRVVPDPTFDCTDIIGKVFDDANLNGYQDEGEQGLPGVRVVSARGLVALTDAYGRYHITCAAVPNEDRGSNFILKLDDRTLPSGYRVTTENPRVQRVTRGKAIKFNFGAAIHRVVRLDIADGVFEEGSTEMRLQWKPRIPMLLDELRKSPSILRLSYLADVEDAGLVKDRLDAVKKEIEALWEEMNCCYKLTIETEIFWRRGGPPDKGSIH